MEEVKKIASEEQKYSYVVAGAYLHCSCSDTYSVLTAPQSHGVYIGQKAQMNIMDFKPCTNVRSFGMCKSLKNPAVAAATASTYGLIFALLCPGLAALNAVLNMIGIHLPGPVKEMPCTPVITKPWEYGKINKLVENQPALLNISQNMCAYGGKITIVDDGQE